MPKKRKRSSKKSARKHHSIRKNLRLYLFMFFVIFSIGLAFYYEYFFRNLISRYPTEQKTTIVTAQKTDNPEILKYQNSEYEFSFRYPKTHSVEGEGNNFSLIDGSGSAVISGVFIKTSLNPEQWWKKLGYTILNATPWEFAKHYHFEYDYGKLSTAPAFIVSNITFFNRIGNPATQLKNNQQFYLITISEDLLVLTIHDSHSNSAVPILKSFRFEKKYSPSYRFRYRQYTPGKDLVQRNDYPRSLTAMPETNLVKMGCAGYSSEGEILISQNAVAGEAVTIEQVSEHQDMYQKIVQSIGNASVSAFTICKTESGKTLVIYQTNNSLLIGNDVYIADLVDGDLNVLTMITPDNAENWGCRRPLQLTKDNSLFVLCGGGTGYWPGSYIAIYEVNIERNTITPFKKCSWIWENSPEDTVLVCDW